MSEFKRENRYTVIKHNQLTESQMQYLKNCIFGEGIPTVEAVVIESDWPEFEPAWKMIEDRVTGAPVEGGKAEYDAMASAMTTNQTIDGVPRSAIEAMLGGTQAERIKAFNDLRALLDEPALERKPFGWFRTPKDCPLQGMFLHYDTEHGERDIQNALDFGFTVKRLYDTPDAQPQGEPVAWLGVHHVLGAIHNVPGFPGVKGNHIHDLTALLNGVLTEAEQPAPVAVACFQGAHEASYPSEQRASVAVVPERQEVDVHSEFYDSGWNACLDEVARLTATVRTPEPLVMTDGLHTYEYVTGHNAAIDKMLGVKS